MRLPGFAAPVPCIGFYSSFGVRGRFGGRSCPVRRRWLVCVAGEVPKVTVTADGAAAAAAAAPSTEVASAKRSRGRPRGFTLSEETRRKMSASRVGRRDSPETRQRKAASRLGRSSWNRGVPWSEEVRSRIAESNKGRAAWNKGRPLEEEHRQRIREARQGKQFSAEHRRQLSLAQRRRVDTLLGSGGDIISEVATSAEAAAAAGRGDDDDDDAVVEAVDATDSARNGNALLGGLTETLHEYAQLRRVLRPWSEQFCAEHGDRRPTLVDVRRYASEEVVAQFERYAVIRQQLRGLTVDMVDHVPPPPKEKKRKKAASHRRTRQDAQTASAPPPPEPTPEPPPPPLELKPLDYRLIGRFRLLGTDDIHEFVSLRRRLRVWSDRFKQTHGRRPTLSDASKVAHMGVSAAEWRRMCTRYLELRAVMYGLMQETYGDALLQHCGRDWERLEALVDVVVSTSRL
ncbi:hypothetical protein CDCA_CDCA04G1444 [Cyanidium caldarium]|uniref:Nuclease associated modular domain-containing protein n=1 Tax=Cyanidium caldarium TaxID=2771 RepID=A0AAV9IT52_CYACA|nr:hypothetical protein CDCA_CDCA04G1444 [Cyanidium caldarium]